MLDGGIDIHVCNDESKHEFTRTSEEKNGHTIIAGKTEYPIEAWGSTKIKVITDDGYASIILKRTALVPGLMTNLVSLPLITEGGVHWSSRSPLRLERVDSSGFCKLFKSGKHIIFNSNLTPVKECVKSVLSANEGSISLKTGKTKRAFKKSFLHRALGHPSREVIDHISEAARDEDIEVLGDKASRTKDCQTCALTKSHEIISRSSDKEHPASKPFERVTVDLIPMRRGYNSHSQIIHFQCPYTQFNMIFTMVNKSDSLINTKRVIELIKSMGFRVRFLHLDGETSLQKELDNLALHEGIKVERTAPYTPAQNGHAEISGRWMVVKGRAFAIEANLPQSLWPQLIVTVGYIMNRTPSKKLGWKTPFESVYAYKPIFSHLDILGNKVYALKHNIPKLDKLTARAHIGYLVGWESTNIYKVWIPSLNRVINTRDVLIDSGNLYDPHELDAIAIKEPGFEETVQALEWNLESAENNRHLNLNADDLTSLDIPIDLDKEQIISDNEDTSWRQFVELPQNSLRQYLLSFSTAKMGNGIRHHRDNLPPQPKGWNQMLRHRFAAEFQAAAGKEYRTLESKGTWEHIDDIKNTNLIPLIWIFDYKFDVDGYLVKFKARLCARGDLQYTEDDTYAATLASQSFRAIMAVTAAYDLETRQFDAVNAFVNAPIRDTIYCPTPRGFE
ncbi:hypothetical protein K3495_g13757 [Podosphaera aphanis]|nr:hypothetical protein K3495_g13757 [Podosphaera aphanis]